MSELDFERNSNGTCTILTEDLEMLLILAASEIRNNPPTDCIFNWEEAINNAFTKIKQY